MGAEFYGGLTVEGFITAALNGHAALHVGIVFVLYVPNGIVGTVRDRLGGPVAKRLPERLRGGRRRFQSPLSAGHRDDHDRPPTPDQGR